MTGKKKGAASAPKTEFESLVIVLLLTERRHSYHEKTRPVTQIIVSLKKDLDFFACLVNK